MTEFLDAVGGAFDFLSDTDVLGVSLTVWCAIAVIISGIGIFVRGNK